MAASGSVGPEPFQTYSFVDKRDLGSGAKQLHATKDSSEDDFLRVGVSWRDSPNSLMTTGS